MEYIKLGRTGLQVSRLVLGTMNFGAVSSSGVYTTEEDSFAIMDKALELGINFFDTADVYGWAFGKRLTEGIIGRWLAQGGDRRDKIVLATKVYVQVGEGPNGKGLSAYHIKRGCEASLKALQTDHIDLYWMHHIERSTPWEEIWQAMEQLVREGKITYVGSSNFAAWHIALAQAQAEKRNFLGLVAEQSYYNLAARAVELEVLPACRELGIGLVAYSPLFSGKLAGRTFEDKSGRRGINYIQKLEQSQVTAFQQWESLCKELGEEPANVALAWLLHQDGVTAPIIGPRTIQQLEGSPRALEIKLPPEVLKRLDVIFPPIGKGGPAPEAYAW
jgi:aryl-alcohol dehydrogenase-like predicted oxidoreductase